MNSTEPTIPVQTARHVLWHFGHDGGWQPGSFTQRLIEAFAAADMVNTAKLAAVYPDYAAAMIAAQLDPDGLAALQRTAAGSGPLACTCGDTDGPFTANGRCETCHEAAA